MNFRVIINIKSVGVSKFEKKSTVLGVLELSQMKMNLEIMYMNFLCLNRGIKHDFPFINICKIPREMLKTEGEARGFQPSRGPCEC